MKVLGIRQFGRGLYRARPFEVETLPQRGDLVELPGDQAERMTLAVSQVAHRWGPLGTGPLAVVYFAPEVSPGAEATERARAQLAQAEAAGWMAP